MSNLLAENDALRQKNAALEKTVGRFRVVAALFAVGIVFLLGLNGGFTPPASALSTATVAKEPTLPPPRPVAVKSGVKPLKVTLNIPMNIKDVIIEVGTNARGAFAETAAQRPNTFYIGVEPVRAEAAIKQTCGGTSAGAAFKSRCTIIAGAVSNLPGWATFNIAQGPGECSSMLSGGMGCGKVVSTSLLVPLLTLDDIIDMIPRDLPVAMLALDCQGFDFFAGSSLRRNRHRVSNFALECQDLNLDDPLMIINNPGVRNCAQSVACIAKFWEGWRLEGCIVNNFHVSEYNCHWANPKHPSYDVNMRHNPAVPYESLTLTATCPASDWLAGSS